ncbi:PNGase F N-terminal domain-containing protein [Plebeiibacterium sediminum]|uniref:Peptide-N-glycosidase F-related protein n=1 Tax=Plebeiibacterium sediminum TaxID=2992112 RepID=A0AAE3M8Y4_9BACT|nr:PNGase F N-terminal domain-containing protein [Plebeiobacterium sediminum]MCW3789157.1 peptide-N-glycosidase F-related protein [Plebeiobacterium sediminum]
MKSLRIFVLLIILLIGYNGLKAKEKSKKGFVEYSYLENGKIDQKSSKTILHYANGIAKSWVDKSNLDLIDEVPKQYTYFDYSQNKIYQQAIFMSGDTCFTAFDFRIMEGFQPEGETEMILGYACQKYVGSSFSNKIELWVTEDIGIKGTPLNYFPYQNGFVLKYVRNGNSGWEATKINFSNKVEDQLLYTHQLGDSVSDVEFRKKLTNAFIKDVQVFSNEQINWGDEIRNPEGIVNDSLYRFAGGSIIAKKVLLPAVPDGTSLFAEVTERSNGDAYDRTGSVFVIPQNKEKSFLDGLRFGKDALPKYFSEGNEYQGVVSTKDYDPLIELMRFFTPFGVGHFNEKRNVGFEWSDSVVYKQDVTHLLPVLQKECWIGVFIGNYDGGGHKVSLNLKYHLNSQEKPKKSPKRYWVQPVFNTTNVMEMAGQQYGTMFKNDTLTVNFNVPKGVKNIEFYYISTGHGGWGNGDEFVQKQNSLFIDGKSFFNYTPWRYDCGTYRKFNPASGNFWNGMSSSDYSRSGWCPGSVSHPYYTTVNDLQEGNHVIQVYIPIGEPEGNMFSAWNISGLFIGSYEE